MSKCHQKSAKYIKKQLDGKPTCLICKKEYINSSQVRNHIFSRHSDIEVQAVYETTLEKFLGKYELKRLRAPLMTTITKWKFIEFVESLLSDKKPFQSSELEFDFPLLHDMELLNQQKRKNFYLKKRELLLKLAPVSTGQAWQIGSEFPHSSRS